MSYPIQKPILSSEKTQIRNSRMVFANFVSQRQQVDFGDKIFTPKFTASDITTKNTGALFTTKEERDLILNLPSTGTSAPAPNSDCPVNFNAVNTWYQSLTGIVNYFKVFSINGSNITIQVPDPVNGGYITLSPLAITQMNVDTDFDPMTYAVYVNASSGSITIDMNGNPIVLSPCGAIPIPPP